MLVFIDESGCAGFKFSKGSNPNFCVAMVIFKSDDEARQTAKTIDNTAIAVGQKPEFKFCKCQTSTRDAFFEDVIKHDFLVRAIVIDKQKLESMHLRSHTDQFYNYFVHQLMKHDNDILVNARVKIDGSGDRKFKRSMNKYLRHELRPGKIRYVRMVDSKKDRLIQLADMCVGAIARKYNPNRNMNDRWANLLSTKINDIWTFPG